jgi:hypothetical protein
VDPNYTIVSKIRKEYLPERAPYGSVHERLADMGRTYLAEHR